MDRYSLCLPKSIRKVSVKMQEHMGSNYKVLMILGCLFIMMNLSQGVLSLGGAGGAAVQDSIKSALESDLESISMHPFYTEDVWDCSEMSFYLQYELEKKGYNAWVVLAKGNPGHAWVLVITGTEEISIEATTMQIVPSRRFDLAYRNAVDAIADDVLESEVDWWWHRQPPPPPISGSSVRLGGSQ